MDIGTFESGQMYIDSSLNVKQKIPGSMSLQEVGG